MTSGDLHSEPPVATLSAGLFVAWKADCFRSRATARTFGVPIVLLGSGGGRLVRYAQLMRQTWRVLGERRPRTILCLNQPPMLPMLCWLWALGHGATVVQDFHSGALTHRYWRPFRPIYWLMARVSPFTIAHNRLDASRLQRWGAGVSVLLTLPGPASAEKASERTQTNGRPRFLFVCTFASDEPVDAALQAFAARPEADFWVTGNFRKAGLDPATQPPNVRLLGFIDYAEYQQLMATSTAIITLSDRPHIMQMAVEEAITLGVPVLTNCSPTLEEALGDAGVFVEPTAVGIAAGVSEVLARADVLTRSAREARARCWTVVENELGRLRARHPELFA